MGKVTVKVDSCSVDNCAPKTTCQAFKLRQTEASKAGLKYRAANGSPINNYGERLVKGVTDDGQKTSMAFQIADVRTPLASVYQIVKAGNRVIFEKGQSRVENLSNHRVTPIRENHGSYEFDLWLPSQSQNNNSVFGRRTP